GRHPARRGGLDRLHRRRARGGGLSAQADAGRIRQRGAGTMARLRHRGRTVRKRVRPGDEAAAGSHDVLWSGLLPAVITVVFACLHNAGRSQMAAAFFNALADPATAQALSAGTQPADRVNPVVIEAMHEAGIALDRAVPKKLT